VRKQVDLLGHRNGREGKAREKRQSSRGGETVIDSKRGSGTSLLEDPNKGYHLEVLGEDSKALTRLWGAAV